jgi:serine/threonine protein kinase
VLYAMCTGHSPFRAETFMAAWRRLCMDTPRPIRETNPEVPEWLAEIVEKLHAKLPRDRFQAAEEVSDLLARHLAHLQQPTTAPRPRRLRSRRTTLRRLRGAAYVVVAMLLVCLVTVADRWWSDQHPAQDRVQANAAAEAGRTEAGPSEPADVGSPAASDVPRGEWPDELAETETDIRRVEDQLRQRASTLPSTEQERLMAIEAALQALERELERGR